VGIGGGGCVGRTGCTPVFCTCKMLCTPAQREETPTFQDEKMSRGGSERESRAVQSPVSGCCTGKRETLGTGGGGDTVHGECHMQ
jgi:hypothetical protein